MFCLVCLCYAVPRELLYLYSSGLFLLDPREIALSSQWTLFGDVNFCPAVYLAPDHAYILERYFTGRCDKPERLVENGLRWNRRHPVVSIPFIKIKTVQLATCHVRAWPWVSMIHVSHQTNLTSFVVISILNCPLWIWNKCIVGIHGNVMPETPIWYWPQSLLILCSYVGINQGW